MTLIHRLVRESAAVANHPIYVVESKIRSRSKWGAFSWLNAIMVFLLVFLPFMALWGGLTWLRLLEADSSSVRRLTDTEIIYVTSQEVMGWLLLISVGLALILDLVSILVSVNAINRERLSSHWDLIRLTDLEQEEVIRSKYALAQERTLRMLMMLVSMRLSLVLINLLFAAWVVVPYADQTNIEMFLEQLEETDIETLIGVAILLVIYIVYIIEPFWRMRALTAFGLAVSARVLDSTQAILTGLAGIAFMWFSQGILIVMFLILLSIFARLIEVDTIILGLILGLMVMLIFATLVRNYYALIWCWSLKRALRYGFLREV